MGEKILGHMVDRLMSVGSTEGGEHVHVTFGIKDDIPMTLIFPLRMNSGLITALMTGGSIAYEDQRKSLDEEALANKLGFTNLQPSEVQTVQAVSPAGERRVLLRLKYKGYPAVDIELTLEDARMVSDMLLKTANGDQPPVPKIQ